MDNKIITLELGIRQSISEGNGFIIQFLLDNNFVTLEKLMEYLEEMLQEDAKNGFDLSYDSYHQTNRKFYDFRLKKFHNIQPKIIPCAVLLEWIVGRLIYLGIEMKLSFINLAIRAMIRNSYDSSAFLDNSKQKYEELLEKLIELGGTIDRNHLYLLPSKILIRYLDNFVIDLDLELSLLNNKDPESIKYVIEKREGDKYTAFDIIKIFEKIIEINIYPFCITEYCHLYYEKIDFGEYDIQIKNYFLVGFFSRKLPCNDQILNGIEEYEMDLATSFYILLLGGFDNVRLNFLHGKELDLLSSFRKNCRQKAKIMIHHEVLKYCDIDLFLYYVSISSEKERDIYCRLECQSTMCKMCKYELFNGHLNSAMILFEMIEEKDYSMLPKYGLLEGKHAINNDMVSVNNEM